MYTIESLRVQFPPLGAYTFAVGFGFDTPVLAAGLFILFRQRNLELVLSMAIGHWPAHRCMC